MPGSSHIPGRRPLLLVGGVSVCLLLFVTFDLTQHKPERVSATPSEAPGSATTVRRLPDDRDPIRVAMTAAFVSEAGVGIYERIVDYIENEMEYPFEFVTGLSYSAVDSMINQGVVQVAFICGLPYVMNVDGDSPSIELLVAPVMQDERYSGEPKYYSHVIVGRASNANSFRDLQGKRFAFNEETSNSGYNMPRARLIDLGMTDGFFADVVRTGSHEESIRYVAEGMADASCVDSLVLDYELVRGGEHAAGVRIIERLGPAGIPPVVVSTSLDPRLRDRIRGALIGMNKTSKGREILDQAHVSHFTAVDDSNYDDVRSMWKAARDSDYLKIR